MGWNKNRGTYLALLARTTHEVPEEETQRTSRYRWERAAPKECVRASWRVWRTCSASVVP